MNVIIIPSWYPSEEHPHTGIFIKEQAIALAEVHPTHNVGIFTWGSNNDLLLLEKKNWALWLFRIYRGLRMKRKKIRHNNNCFEYFSPSFSWTRSFLKGNINNIVKACEINLKQYIDEFGHPDIIHAHVAYPAGFISMELGRKYGIPFIVTEHMGPFPFPTFRKKDGQLKRIIRAPYDKSLRNIAVSAHLGMEMRSEGIPHVEVIPNLTNESFFRPSSNKQRNGGCFTFAFVGRLEKQKGLLVLVKAAALLKQRYSDFKVIIVGGGPLAGISEQTGNKLGLAEKLEWTGVLSREGVKSTLEKSHALILPSFHENNPLVILEALAMGIPIIATRCGGPEEIVNEQLGFLIDPESESQLADAMLTIIRNYGCFKSEKIRNHFLSTYSRKVVTKRLTDIYEDVVSKYLSG